MLYAGQDIIRLLVDGKKPYYAVLGRYVESYGAPYYTRDVLDALDPSRVISIDSDKKQDSSLAGIQAEELGLMSRRDPSIRHGWWRVRKDNHPPGLSHTCNTHLGTEWHLLEICFSLAFCSYRC